VILFLLAAEASVIDPYAVESDDFEQYRSCVLREADVFVRTNADAETIFLASRSRCRIERLSVQVTFAAHGASSAAANAADIVSSPHFGRAPENHLDELDRDLSEDVANRVLTKRLKR
jgi:hypothetical protein